MKKLKVFDKVSIITNGHEVESGAPYYNLVGMRKKASVKLAEGFDYTLMVWLRQYWRKQVMPV